MLNKSNILALVGGGKIPQFSKNKLTLYDDHQGMIISQLRFNTNVIGVKLRNDYIITILENKIYIFNLNNLQTIDTLDTFINKNGLVAISYNNTKFSMAFPNISKGKIQIQTYLPTKTSKTINAHESNIAFICINNDGNILATASDKGTLIRIFSINSGELITELRRGAKNVKITCLVFDIGNNYIACSSDVGTIHIFNIESVSKLISEEVIDENKEGENENKNKKNNKKKLIKNARSFAKFRIQDNSSMVCFGKENFIVIITSEGAYYKATFDPKNGGNCCKVEEQVINV